MAYNIVNTKHLIKDGDMSADITSAVFSLMLQDNIGIQLIWTDDAAGDFSIEVSLDHEQDALGNVVNEGTWSPLNLITPLSAGGTAGNVYADLNQLSAPYMRIVYTMGSGAGTLQAYVCAKGV